MGGRIKMLASIKRRMPRESFRVKSPQKNEICNGIPPDFDENLDYMVRKEDLPNNSVFGKVLSEIWALKVLLKHSKLARPPHKKPATTPKI